MTVVNTRGLKKGGKTRFKGVVADAKTLGVCVEHLHLVLAGKRISSSLMERYVKLKTEKGSKS